MSTTGETPAVTDGPGTTIADFEQATGINMTYRKDYNDNDEYFTKVFEPNLGKGKRIEPDIVAPTSGEPTARCCVGAAVWPSSYRTPSTPHRPT